MILGKYKHFKGGKYITLCIALDSETKEEIVVYKDIENGHIWTRPLSTSKAPFDSQVESGPRFLFEEKVDTLFLHNPQELIFQAAQEIDSQYNPSVSELASIISRVLGADHENRVEHRSEPVGSDNRGCIQEPDGGTKGLDCAGRDEKMA